KSAVGPERSISIPSRGTGTMLERSPREGSGGWLRRSIPFPHVSMGKEMERSLTRLRSARAPHSDSSGEDGRVTVRAIECSISFPKRKMGIVLVRPRHPGNPPRVTVPFRFPSLQWEAGWNAPTPAHCLSAPSLEPEAVHLGPRPARLAGHLGGQRLESFSPAEACLQRRAHLDFGPAGRLAPSFDEDHHLAGGRLGGVACGELVQRSAHELLVHLGQLASH